MKAGKSSKMIFTALIMLALLCSSVTIGQAAEVRLLSPTEQPVQTLKQRTLQTTTSSQVTAPVVQRVIPSHPSLTAGGNPVTVTLEGSDLDLITSVQILLNSKIVSNVAAHLGAAAATLQGTSPARDMESKVPQPDLAKRSSDVSDRLVKRLPDSRPSGTVMIDTVPLPEKPASGLPGLRFPDRQVTLTAQSGALAGNYQVRIIVGSQTINLSTDVLTVVVKATVGRAPSPSAGSSGSGDGVVGVSPLPEGDPKQASDASGAKDGFPVQGSDAGSGRPTGFRGPAASNPSARMDKASGRSVPSLTTPAGVPSRQLASSQASKVEVRDMSPSVNLQPREYQPTVNRVAVSPEEVMALRQAGTITSAVFNHAVKDALSAASFRANSCGGTWEVRRITIDIPNTYNNNDTSLSRLDYELTDGEKESSQRTRNQDYRRDIHIRISKIRACIDDWLSNNWTGNVEGGEFKVSLPFRLSSVIKTRAIERWDKHGSWIWTDRWDWDDPSADSALHDYVLSGIVLEITLSPSISNGTVTYSGVDAKWNVTYGEFQAPLRKSYWPFIQMIMDFKGEKLEEIRQQVNSLFNEPAVRKRISDALTAQVLDNQFVNRITGLTGGSGDTVAYKYE